jgi:hypothetical protein
MNAPISGSNMQRVDSDDPQRPSGGNRIRRSGAGRSKEHARQAGLAKAAKQVLLPGSVPSGGTASDSTAINVLISRVTPDFNDLLCNS